MQKLLENYDLDRCVVVFDLDDTLYKEIDFYKSGIKNVLQHLELNLNVAISYEVKKQAFMSSNFLDYLCKACNLSDDIKRDLLNVYRLHIPNISLDEEIAGVISRTEKYSKNLIILTDGRSITQRNKIKSLGLEHCELYISEEFQSEKPDLKRFQLIEKKYPNCIYFYIGDNVKKDFIAPNSLDWVTIGLRDNGKNIHKNGIKNFPKINCPTFWVNSLSELI
jgi:putative hydrolase of the HAD superfamily